MIQVGATVYIAPGVENVKYLKRAIQGGHLFLDYYMIGKITRYTNAEDKVGIEFEYPIWRRKQLPDNHGTGKPGYCAYIPTQFVKEIHPTRVEWFRLNVATTKFNTYLSYKRFSEDVKNTLGWIDKPADWYPISLGTDGMPKMPKNIPPGIYKGVVTGEDWITESSFYKAYKDDQKRQEFNQARNNYVVGFDPYRPVGGDFDVDKSSSLGTYAQRQYGLHVGTPSYGKSDLSMAMGIAINAASFLKEGTIITQEMNPKEIIDRLNNTGYLFYGTSGRPFAFTDNPSYEEYLLTQSKL